MDGSSARCVLLFAPGHFCSLAHCGGDIRGAVQWRNVDVPSLEICQQL
jgi:hypothetical protein